MLARGKRKSVEHAPWASLPGDVVRIVLLLLVKEEERSDKKRLRDLVALKNTCRAFWHAAEKLREAEQVQDAMRHDLYKQHERLKVEDDREFSRNARKDCCNSCGSRSCECLTVVVCCPCILCCGETLFYDRCWGLLWCLQTVLCFPCLCCCVPEDKFSFGGF